MMDGRSFFFAGGGTGGHIYPAVAIAERLTKIEPEANVHFFCSTRNIDSQILTRTDFKYTQLPAQGLSIKPKELMGFCSSFLKSSRIAREMLVESEGARVIGIGGYVAAPVCWAAHKLKIPVVLLNVDSVPGRANKMIARWADEILVQFEDTKQHFGKRAGKAKAVGCPLRSGFDKPEPDKARSELGLDTGKKILLITGASSGSANINEAVCSLLDELSVFSGDWQMVHVTGRANLERVGSRYADAKIEHKILDYYDDMANLLAAADLVVGRSGAVSVAEYAAARVPSICMPYPFHKDRHQYLNAGKLVEAGAAIIVDDLPDARERAEWLWEELEELMKNDRKREEMAKNCEAIANKNAASTIAGNLLAVSK
ncbi:MAG: UDP-N-acetylglucosamine--N-acetylmuramyl-(pentapeptide) pyrophosphoryl-undecaprenol N-acetylglucosamine transferase [Planctomycetota bacterium]|jgi:UDP-N-acetylglucosamine--N-acetylmuramyl-(pentapeptide) pyrophosphoryl-undecaprenol N-acetylglucosamine transferase